MNLKPAQGLQHYKFEAYVMYCTRSDVVMEITGGLLRAVRYLSNIRHAVYIFIIHIRYSYAVFVICKQQFVIRKRYSVLVIYMRSSSFFYRIPHEQGHNEYRIGTYQATCPIRYGKSNSIFVKSMALTRY